MSSNRIITLMQAVRPAIVVKYTGQLLLILVPVSCVPFLVSLPLSEFTQGQAYLYPALFLVPIAILMSRLQAASNLQHNETMVIVALIFILAPLLMSFPIHQHGIGFSDALFEAVSAVTTTGLSPLAQVEDKSDTFLFTRAWLQWNGGLGIVVLSLALLIGPGTAARRLSLTSIDRDNIPDSTRLHARRILSDYLTLTVLGIIVLRLFDIDWYEAMLHVLSGVSTGVFFIL